MSRRGPALRLAAAVAVALVGGVPTAASSAWAAAPPHLALATTTIVPGQEVAVSGTGWAAGAALTATVCGADAVGGTADCANTAASELIASPTGVVTGYVNGALPPQPCPCVVLVIGLNTQFTQKIPVTVVGAATAPVPPAPTTEEPDLRIQDLRVAATLTAGSAMGAAAPRTVELRLHNAGPYPETPELIGRWGHPTEVNHAITMPSVGSVAAGATKEVRATFSLPAFSVGTYIVLVTAEVVGFAKQTSATRSTTQWPFGLFALGVVLLVLLVVGLATQPRRRRRRRARRPPPPPPAPQSPAVPRRLASSAESEARSEALSGR